MAAGGWPSKTSGAGGPTRVQYTTNKQNVYLLDFDSGSDEYAEWTLVMPTDWNAGTVTAIFYWLANSSSTNSVVWALQGRSYGDGEAIDAAWGTAQTVTDANTGTNQINISAATSAITLAGTPAASELVQFRAYRDADNGSDNLAVDARLLAVRVMFTRA